MSNATDNNRELAVQLKEMATQNEFDTQVALRRLMLATAYILESTDPAVIAMLKADVEMLKKRDWVNLGIASLLALFGGIAAYFRK